MGRLRRLPRRPARARQGGTLLHRDPAAERDRLIAYGSRAQQYAPGHSLPVRAHARQGRAVAAGNGPCRHRDAGGGRAPAHGTAGIEPRHGPRGLHQARLGMEGGIRRHHHRAAQAARRVLRLVARALHHGRGAVARGAESLRAALSRRADLQGQAAGQLGPEAEDRDLRSRSAAGREQGSALVHQISDRRLG